jgi:hypothetical protein
MAKNTNARAVRIPWRVRLLPREDIDALLLVHLAPVGTQVDDREHQ